VFWRISIKGQARRFGTVLFGKESVVYTISSFTNASDNDSIEE